MTGRCIRLAVRRALFYVLHHTPFKGLTLLCQNLSSYSVIMGPCSMRYVRPVMESVAGVKVKDENDERLSTKEMLSSRLQASCVCTMCMMHPKDKVTTDMQSLHQLWRILVCAWVQDQVKWLAAYHPQWYLVDREELLSLGYFQEHLCWVGSDHL